MISNLLNNNQDKGLSLDSLWSDSEHLDTDNKKSEFRSHLNLSNSDLNYYLDEFLLLQQLDNDLSNGDMEDFSL